MRPTDEFGGVLAGGGRWACECGDNLGVTAGMADGCVDLVYLDPPFCSGRDYSHGGRVAFRDKWKWGPGAEKGYAALVAPGGRLAEVLTWFRRPGPSPLLAYLVFMAPRLVELRRVLKPTGSLYLHCDDSASHYLRVLLDAVFGAERFLNAIRWRRTHSHGGATKNYAKICDTIFFYARGPRHTFHPSAETETDLIEDLVGLNQNAKERVGYPTQKPVELLGRLVRAASDPGDVVFDPFAGSGSALVAAVRLGRRAVGCDRNPDAVAVTRRRLARCGPGTGDLFAGVRQPGLPAGADG